MNQYVMALDAGTTSSRCILFDRKGNICSVSQREFEQIYPHPGWVEHNPMDIWSSQIGVAAEAMGKLGAGPENIAAVGITNQRETTIVWEKSTGRPVYNAIVWQCRRTADMVEELVQEGFGEHIREVTGLIPDPYFSATKLKWILDHVEGAREKAERGELLFGTVDTWLIWKMTDGQVHVTDYTNASRTMMFDIHKLCWDEGILKRLGIPECMLPEVVPSSAIYGRTKDCMIGDGIPICGA
ncbi:MAG: glycerol kinase, partial [Lachnospiraceae bacterium]|nr:glycerol kinase [Lachnospiraceae bacterium]